MDHPVAQVLNVNPITEHSRFLVLYVSNSGGVPQG